MAYSDEADVRARFLNGVDSTARTELVVALNRRGVTTNVGLDLGDRVPERGQLPTLVITIMSDPKGLKPGVLSAIGVEASTWLEHHAANGTDPFIEVELRATGSAAVIRIATPEKALLQLDEILQDPDATAPRRWTGQMWDQVEQALDDGAVSSGPIRAAAVRVLTLDTEWFSVKGGLSTFNRELCIALVKAGADVYCVVPKATSAEQAHASSVGVQLVSALAQPGVEGRELLMQRPKLPAGWEPDLIIGHGRITGPHAKTLAEGHFPRAARIHIVHQISDEVEWLRPWQSRAGEVAEANIIIDVDLAKGATKALGVGPRLHDIVLRELAPHGLASLAGRIDPGFDIGDSAPRVPPPGSPKQVMVMGRLDDWKAKGLDLAARIAAGAIGLARMSELELLLRGVPVGEHAALRGEVEGWAASPLLRVTPRAYTPDAETLRVDLRRASLFLAPARAEAFGLVGLEAIAAGTPALISAHSGLGMLIRSVLKEKANLVVLPLKDEDRDLQVWVATAAAILRDPSAAFKAAEELRQQMAGEVTWGQAASVVLEVYAEALRQGRR